MTKAEPKRCPACNDIIPEIWSCREPFHKDDLSCPQCHSRNRSVRGRLSMGQGVMPNSGMYVCDNQWHSPAPEAEPKRCPTCGSDRPEMNGCSAHPNLPWAHRYVRFECVRCTDLWHSPAPDAGAKGYIGPCPKCGTQLGFGHLPEKCNGKLIAPAPAEGAELLGMPVRLDDSMPKGTVELRNASGELLGKIENIGAPAEGVEPHAANNWRHWNELCKTAQEQARVAIAELASLREQLERSEANCDVLESNLAKVKEQLAEAAREINCSGPVAHRIRVLKQHHEEQLAREKELHFAANGLKECFAKALENVKEQLAQAQRELEVFKKAGCEWAEERTQLELKLARADRDKAGEENG